jgi:predicted transcriptional regulator
MAAEQPMDKLSIYIQEKHRSARVGERLSKLGEKRDRSINVLVAEAIVEYLVIQEAR